MWSLLNKGLAEKYKLFVVHNHKVKNWFDKKMKKYVEPKNKECNSNDC